MTAPALALAAAGLACCWAACQMLLSGWPLAYEAVAWGAGLWLVLCAVAAAGGAMRSDARRVALDGAALLR